MKIRTAVRRGAYVLAAGLLVGASLGTASPAGASTAPSAAQAVTAQTVTTQATGCTQVVDNGVVLSYCGMLVTRGAYSVVVLWGFAYRPNSTHSGNLRAWTEVAWTRGLHVQVDALNLGDRNGVLASVGPVHDPTAPVQTAAVSCHWPSGYYNSNNHFSIRWVDGTPLHTQTGLAAWHLATDICP